MDFLVVCFEIYRFFLHRERRENYYTKRKREKEKKGEFYKERKRKERRFFTLRTLMIPRFIDNSQFFHFSFWSSRVLTAK